MPTKHETSLSSNIIGNVSGWWDEMTMPRLVTNRAQQRSRFSIKSRSWIRAHLRCLWKRWRRKQSAISQMKLSMQTASMLLRFSKDRRNFLLMLGKFEQQDRRKGGLWVSGMRRGEAWSNRDVLIEIVKAYQAMGKKKWWSRRGAEKEFPIKSLISFARSRLPNFLFLFHRRNGKLLPSAKQTKLLPTVCEIGSKGCSFSVSATHSD